MLGKLTRSMRFMSVAASLSLVDVVIMRSALSACISSLFLRYSRRCFLLEMARVCIEEGLGGSGRSQGGG